MYKSRLPKYVTAALVAGVAIVSAPAVMAQGGFEGPGRYEITNVGAGKALALDRNDKTTIMVFPPLNKDNQQWDAHPADEGYWVLRNVFTGAALEAMSPEDGAPVRGMPFTQSPSQQWRIEPGPGGSALIINRSGRALAAAGRGREEGRVVTFEPKGGAREQFVFRKLVVAIHNPPPPERELYRDQKREDEHSGYFDDRDQMWKLNGDGVCFYRGPNYQGKALCVRTGEEMRRVPADWLEVFRSVKFFGRVRGVMAFHDLDFQGARVRIEHDEPDLENFRSDRGEPFQRTVKSLRVF